jgi:hypothetical protein
VQLTVKTSKIPTTLKKHRGCGHHSHQSCTRYLLHRVLPANRSCLTSLGSPGCEMTDSGRSCGCVASTRRSHWLRRCIKKRGGVLVPLWAKRDRSATPPRQTSNSPHTLPASAHLANTTNLPKNWRYVQLFMERRL